MPDSGREMAPNVSQLATPAASAQRARAAKGVRLDDRAPSDAPAWFKAAVEAQKEELRVPVGGGVELEVLRWGGCAPQRQAVVFVHGNGANAHWYSFIAPFFADRFEVVAISSSGCGSSDEREDAYHAGIYADEVVKVCEALGYFARFGKPILVAHSLGSVISMRVALACGERFAGVVLTDVRMEDFAPDVFERRQQAMMAERRKSPLAQRREGWKVHSTAAAAPVDKFKLAPAQPCNYRFVLEYVANTSSEPAGAGAATGWRWKGDCNRFGKLDLATETPHMSLDEVRRAQLKVPLAFVYGADSFFMRIPSIKATVEGPLRALAPVVVLPNARHHLMLDEPLAFIGAVSALIAAWTTPSARL